MSSPDIAKAEHEAVVNVLGTSSLSIGPRIECFEKGVATRIGARYAIAVNSGTSGLHLAVIASGVTEGDLVITTPFSFIASSNAVLYERGVPVFVDVDPATGNIDPALLAECVSDMTKGGAAAHPWLPPSLRESSNGSHPPFSLSPSSLKALLPVHAFGQPADLDPIVAVAKEHGLKVIEDSCEAIGATYKGRQAGTLGDAGVFAFYPNKQITTGEGGMIVTNHADWDALFRSLRNQGRDVFDSWLNHTRLGYNYRLDEMSAALGLAQLGRLDELLEKRARVAGWYNERLSDQELIELPYIAPTTTRMSWFVYIVRIRPPANRDRVMQCLAEKGIPSRPYFTPIHLQPFYAEKFGYGRGDFPVTEYLGDVSLALPFSSVMTEEQVGEVCEHLISVVEGSAVSA